MKHAIRHIHFIGLGGAGMSAIAEVLYTLGYIISGSDLVDSPTLQRLAGIGIKVFIGHSPEQLIGANAVVTSTAIKADNPEVLKAKEVNIPVVPRALMLAELMRLQRGIAIAGTHGKTTTACLVTSILVEAGIDPTFVIGGRLNSVGTNARLGKGDYIVVEADESDASFLCLLPVMAVITNIDADHMETYNHDLRRLKQAFIDFLHRMPFYGTAILCTDDPGVQSILANVSCSVISYGFNAKAQVRAVDVQAIGTQMHFTVQRRHQTVLLDLPIVLNLAGKHNVLNALSAIAIATELGLPDAAVQKALANFSGVGRRFQSHGQIQLSIDKNAQIFNLIEDYGHHPVELRATIAAAKGAFPGSRLVLAFQPHRYTRTRDCFEGFVQVLGEADAVLLAEVYAAGETPISEANGRSLAQALRAAGKIEPVFVDGIENMAQAILSHVGYGDVVLCMGAGSIGDVPAQVLALLQNSVRT